MGRKSIVGLDYMEDAVAAIRAEDQGRAMTTDLFQRGQVVVYTPTVGDQERGVVSSTNHKYVFVKYECATYRLPALNADTPITAQATLPQDLMIHDERFVAGRREGER